MPDAVAAGQTKVAGKGHAIKEGPVRIHPSVAGGDGLSRLAAVAWGIRIAETLDDEGLDPVRIDNPHHLHRRKHIC
jgi:hypothetical protein